MTPSSHLFNPRFSMAQGNELDQYERTVMGGGSPPPSSGSGPSMMPVTITVPADYDGTAGQALKVSYLYA